MLCPYKDDRTVMDLIEQFKQRARTRPGVVVYPEAEDERILRAASVVAADGFAKPVVLGQPEVITQRVKELSVAWEGVAVVDPLGAGHLDRYAADYAVRREGVTEATARRLIRKSVFYGAAMVAAGDAQAMVGGVMHSTALIIQAAALLVGYAPGVTSASSFFIMVVPKCLGETNKLLIFADCAVNIDPSAEQLADTAVAAGRNASALIGVEPHVAMLSFSTKGSAVHPLADKVIEATRLACEKAPDLLIDGELQADAALVPTVAARKVKESPVAGQANVLVFPDLDAANIAYKLTQYLGNAKAYGPVLQGFAKPVSDLSRGASVNDIIAATAITLAQAIGA